MMVWLRFFLVVAAYQTAKCLTLPGNKVENKVENKHSESQSKNEQQKSTKKSSVQKASYKTSQSSPYSSFEYSSGLDFPFGFRYASDYDTYSLPLDLDPDLDPDFFFIDPDLDTDLDLDFNDVDLDIDLLKLKYGLYGLNHYSLREPHFNDYRYRKRYRLRKKPYYRLHHRYLPKYWKSDLDFWGLDNYSLGFDYGSYSYEVNTPHSYVHVRRYS